MEIGRQIRVMRAVRGKAQKSFSRQCLKWKDDGLLSNIELRKSLPTPEQMAQIRAGLNWPDAPLDELAFAILEGEIPSESALVEWLDQHEIVGIPFVDPPLPAA